MLAQRVTRSNTVLRFPAHRFSQDPLRGKILDGAARWRRLRRYAKWREGVLHLDKLPGDVLQHMAESFLSPADFCHLVEALAGRPLDPGRDVASVPRELQSTWVVHNAMHAFERHLYRLGDVALYHARHGSVIFALVDWSPYARTPPSPVAEYWWAGGRGPHARVELRRDAMLQVLQRCCARGLPCVQVSLYYELRWRRAAMIHPQPVYMGALTLVPSLAHLRVPPSPPRYPCATRPPAGGGRSPPPE
jgi:hypothetical protein